MLFNQAQKLIHIARDRHLQEQDLLPLPHEIQLHQQSALDLSILRWTRAQDLLKDLLWSTRKQLRWAYFFYALSVMLSLSQPWVIHHFMTSLSLDLKQNQFLSQALVFAILLGLTSILRGFFLQHYFYQGLIAYQRVINMINEKVFRHSLEMSSSTQQQFALGDVVNHMSADSDSIADYVLVIADLVSTVVLLAGSTFLLFYYLGAAAIAPFILMICLLPVTSWIARRFTRIDDHLMKKRDQRVTLMGQVLQAIRVIKYFTWEKGIQKEVSDLRDQELFERKRLAEMEYTSSLIYALVSSLILLSAFVALAYLERPLNAALVFTTISLFALIEEPLSHITWTLSRWTNAKVAAQRIAKFLTLPTLSVLKESPSSQEKSLAVEAKSVFCLQNQSFYFQAGQCHALIGPVGSGKSRLLMSLVQEVPEDRGHVVYLDSKGESVQPRRAFVTQETFILNGSLRENLLFDQKNISEEQIQKALYVSCLDQDLQFFAAGLETEIGERGVNLSGGQKQRVSLARAYLSSPQVVFMDDPFSALDIETEQKILDRLIFGEWCEITRVISTHRLEVLAKAQQIYFLEDLKLQFMGTFKEIQNRERFQRFLNDYTFDQNLLVNQEQKNNPTKSNDHFRLTEDEEREIGAVKKSLYLDYFKFLGGLDQYQNLRLSMMILGMFVVLFLAMLQRWWLGDRLKSEASADQVWFALGVYALMGFSTIVLTFINSKFWIQRGLAAGRELHEQMLTSLLSAKIRFFDSTPVGRVLQRFSRDIESADIHLPRSFEQATSIFIEILLCLILIAISAPFSFAAIIPLLYFYYRVQNDYRRPAREVKRFDSTARSPRYAHFKETLSGLTLLRAYSKQQWFIAEFSKRLEYSQKMFYNHYLLNRWFSVRIPLLGGMIALVTAVTIVLSVKYQMISVSLAGLLSIYLMSFWGYLNWGIRVFSEIESRMTSIERLKTYSSLPREEGGLQSPPLSWPKNGKIEFKDVHVRYATHLPLILKGISLQIPAGKRVGIYGRTGSGKSTLFQSLYRFVDIERGQILIDDVDISTIPLEILRKNLSIIPQDPTLFVGTLRSNLDRYGLCTDVEIIDALKQVQLWTLFESQGLAFEIKENGSNLSQGQRQLLCLARALLSRAKVIILDEATASVDLETDEKIQKIIREKMKDTTMLIIAHRLETIEDCDLKVHLSAGRVVGS